MTEKDQLSNVTKEVELDRVGWLNRVQEEMDMKYSEITRLWNDTSNNLTAFADEKRNYTPQLKEFIADALDKLKTKGSKFVDDVEYRWLASHFLLFNDENYLSLGLRLKFQDDSIRLSCSKTKKMLDHLKSVICVTALTIPELREEAEQIMKLEKVAKDNLSDRPVAVVKTSQKPIAIVQSPETPMEIIEFKPLPKINLAPYDPTKIDLGNAELTRLWNINTNNLEAFADQRGRGAPDMVGFIHDMLDEIDPSNAIDQDFKPLSLEKIRWVASNFLLFNSDQCLICASSWSGKDRKISQFLTKVILQTAYTIPELKDIAEEISAAMLQEDA